MSSSHARNPLIDLLRGIAILLVLLLHFTLTYRLEDSIFAEVVSTRSLKALLRNGNYGVTMFFVISGFLITSMSIARFGSLDRVKVPRFYAFRFARIIPCLLLALAIIVPIGLAGVPSFMNRVRGQSLPPSYFLTVVLSVLTFWHNVLMADRGYFNYAINIYWSLSVEEVFYLAFPLLCVLLRRGWLLVLVWAGAILAGPVYRSLHSDDEIFFMYGYPACFDAIAMGCCAAVLSPRLTMGIWWRRALQIGGAALVVVTYLRGIEGHEVLGFTLIAAGTAVLLVAQRPDWDRPEPERVSGRLVRAARAFPRRGLDALRWLGRHSYELYLFHIIVLGLMREIIKGKELHRAYKPFWLLAYLLISALVAGLIARLYSEPLNRRLRAVLSRWEKAR